jgi:hypothetical protein
MLTRVSSGHIIYSGLLKEYLKKKKLVEGIGFFDEDEHPPCRWAWLAQTQNLKAHLRLAHAYPSSIDPGKRQSQAVAFPKNSLT